MRERQPATIVLLALVLVATLASLRLYAGNVARYGRINPSCDTVLGEEACMANRIFARNRVVTSYRTGETTFEEAVRESGRIGHAGDRDRSPNC